MNKNYLLTGLLALGLGVAAISCSDSNDGLSEEQAQNYDYSAANADAWGNYAYNVAMLLNLDSETLYKAWATGIEGDEDYPTAFAESFKNHTSESGYTSAQDCIEQILDGCIDIANEVGTAKIGEPYDYMTSGQTNKALYAVESWYSYHSRQDYMNNILSIANSLLSTRLNLANEAVLTEAMKNNAAANSIYTLGMNNSEISAQVADAWSKTIAAHAAIQNIQQPFRNHIDSEEAEEAMEACDELTKSLEALKSLCEKFSDTDAQAIVSQYVDNVVLPTYEELKNKNYELLQAVVAFKATPTNSTIAAACDAWVAARRPWEASEAFLFGPVDKKGLDPNMDSWPLDAIGIVNLLNSQRWSAMEWSDSDDDEAVEAAQALRGFHTLEFLLYKNGQPRTIQ